MSSDHAGGRWALLQYNFIAVSKVIHSLGHELPEKPTYKWAPTFGAGVDGLVKLLKISVPPFQAVPRES